MYTMQELNFLLRFYVQHHSYSRDLDTTFDAPGIFNYHIIEKKWKHVGYTELTEEYNGRALTLIGRPITMRGAHAIGFNYGERKAYSQCAIGNYDKEAPAPYVWKQLIERALITCLAYKIPVENFIGHWETFIILGKVKTKEDAWRKYKTCPGRKFDMIQFRNDLYKTHQQYVKKSR